MDRALFCRIWFLRYYILAGFNTTYINRTRVTGPVFACAIWVFSANDHIFSKLLSFSWLIVLGEASYGLYLIHIPVAHFWEWMGWSKITSLYPVYLLTPVILSVFSFYFVETPARRWILKRFHTRPKETLEAASDA